MPKQPSKPSKTTPKPAAKVIVPTPQVEPVELPGQPTSIWAQAWEPFGHQINQLARRVKQSGLPWQPAELKRAAVGAGIALLAAVIIAFIGIYGLRWQNPYTRAVSWLVPFPAAYVNGSTINYHDYYGNVHNLEYAITHQSSQTQTPPTAKEVNQQALGQLINQVLYRAGAKQYHITVSKQDVDAAMAQAFANQGGEKSALATLATNYGISKGQYAVMVRDALLRLNLSQAINSDPNNIKIARQQAASVLAKAQAGKDFAVLARQYSKDPSAQATGDQALVDVAILPPAVAAAASAAKDGQVVGQAIKVNADYYIIKRERAAGGKVLARVILIKTSSFDTWLLDQYNHAKIDRLLPQTRL